MLTNHGFQDCTVERRSMRLAPIFESILSIPGGGPTIERRSIRLTIAFQTIPRVLAVAIHMKASWFIIPIHSQCRVDIIATDRLSMHSFRIMLAIQKLDYAGCQHIFLR